MRAPCNNMHTCKSAENAAATQTQQQLLSPQPMYGAAAITHTHCPTTMSPTLHGSEDAKINEEQDFFIHDDSHCYGQSGEMYRIYCITTPPDLNHHEPVSSDV